MDKQHHKILIVDDEEDLCEILQFNLEGEGFITEVAYSAEEALRKNLRSFSLIILDVMMGEMSGFKLADKIRKKKNLSIPIVFITAKNTENDLLTGFNLGADDYITKPFSIKEVVARVKAVIKRSSSKKKPGIIKINGLELDTDKKKAIIDKKKVNLTKKEFEILKLLIQDQGRTFSRTEILFLANYPHEIKKPAKIRAL